MENIYIFKFDFYRDPLVIKVQEEHKHLDKCCECGGGSDELSKKH